MLKRRTLIKSNDIKHHDNEKNTHWVWQKETPVKCIDVENDLRRLNYVENDLRWLHWWWKWWCYNWLSLMATTLMAMLVDGKDEKDDVCWWRHWTQCLLISRMFKMTFIDGDDIVSTVLLMDQEYVKNDAQRQQRRWMRRLLIARMWKMMLWDGNNVECDARWSQGVVNASKS